MAFLQTCHRDTATPHLGLAKTFFHAFTVIKLFMPVWISTVNAIPDLGNGPFKNHKGVIVNAITHAPDREIAINNIVQGLREYRLQIESIDDLDIFHNNKSLPTKSLSKLAAKSQKHFTTEFDIFYTYDE